MSTALRETSRRLHALCRLDALEPGWGEAALINDIHIAVFRTQHDDYFAACHRCPSTGARVMARGIQGDALIEGRHVPTIACPLHKEVFRLDTGQCLNASVRDLKVYPVSTERRRLWIFA